MLKLLPVLLPILYGLLMWWLSARRTRAVLDRQSRPLEHPGLKAAAARLARALDLPEVRVNVYDVEAVNGLAAPDGRIFLTRGFLQQLQAGRVTEDELASVIAHELGHVALGHSRRRMIDFTGQNAVFMMLSAVLGRLLPVIGVWIANLVASALAARLSRKDEFEADAYASALLVKAGIGTAPQKSLFRKLGLLTGQRSHGVPAWLLSHPHVDDRIAAIEANEARWGVRALPPG